MANVLTDPPFANDPPIKVNVNAKILGLVIGILAIIGAVFFLLVSLGGLWIIGNANAVCNSYGYTCTTNGVFILGLIGLLVVLAGYVMSAIGGFRMYNFNRAGKHQVIYGLLLAVVGGIIAMIGYGGFLSTLIFDLIVALVLYYLVVISRFPGEVPLVASHMGGYGSPPPPPPPPV